MSRTVSVDVTAGRGIVLAGIAAQLAVAVLGVHTQAGPLPLPFLIGSVVVAGAMRHRPRRPLVSPGPGAMEDAQRAHGRTHISSFAAGPDKQVVELDCGALVGLRVVARVAVTAGDPLADAQLQPRAIAEFVTLCERQGWDPCFYQTSPALRAAYRAAGLRLVKFGEEAIVDLTGYTLGVPQRANLRREVGRARRAGLSAAVLPWATAKPLLQRELGEVSRSWLERHGQREMGFSLGRLDDAVDARTWLTVVRDAGCRIHAFSTWLPMGADGIALDLVRRSPQARPGAMDLCLAETLEEARRRGMRTASLGSVPMRDVAGSAPDGRLARRLRAILYRHGAGGYRYDSLARFKGKFAPTWVDRDVAFPGSLAAPRALAALAAVHSQGRPGGAVPGGQRPPRRWSRSLAPEPPARAPRRPV
jgi:phosphatidylglycerol lysyltransferase